MKFAHFSDCHIGGWREEELKKLNLEAFSKGIDICIKENVAFVLISGDLFNTSLPQIDLIKDVARYLYRLRENDIEVYIIPGSHDFSPSGKTMLDVLEGAGLCVNVFKPKDNKLEIFTDKTGVKIAGMLGLKGGLEKIHYKEFDFSNLEKEDGFKIFMFHTLLDELKLERFKMIECDSVKAFPKNFDYYAGGHPHYVLQKNIENYGLMTYPGPVFPNNFEELENLKHGGFYIVDDKLNIKHLPLKVKDVISFTFNADKFSAEELEEHIIKTLEKSNLKDKVVTLRIEGTLKSGRPSDIDFNKIFEAAKDAYYILKNTYKLNSKEFEEFNIEHSNMEELEKNIIKEHLSKTDLFEKEEEFIGSLLNFLNKEKDEGETNADFEIRLMKDALKIFKLEKAWYNDNQEN